MTPGEPRDRPAAGHSTSTDADEDEESLQTQPSVEVACLTAGESLEWSFVVVFHPDIRRIGAQALVPLDVSPLRFGRYVPEFAGHGAAPAPLEDPHVSRRAAALLREDSGWRLQRGSARSRLRVDGQEFEDSRCFSADELRAGLSLTLGNRVVLFVRLQERQSGAEGALADAASEDTALADKAFVDEALVDETLAGAALVDEALADEEREPALRALLGISPAMRELRAALRRIARLPDDVLLIGPTGAGKELVARALHACSPLRRGPWVPVNMAAMPVELAAASLFGARRGAYTGAQTHRQGYFQQARDGVLFLDEVGDTPEALQPQLLRALQEREIQVLGGAVERVNLRVVAATEREPETLRSALRHRLGTQELRLPALVERREDLGLLLRAIFAEYAARDGRRWPIKDAPDAELARWVRLVELFLAYAWPGNVRELRAVIAQIHAASSAGLSVPASVLTRLQPEHALAPVRALAPASGGGARAVREPAPVSLAHMTDAAFEAAWREAHCEVTRMARKLGVSRAAIYRRVKSSPSCRLANDVPLEELLATLDECRGDLASTARQLGISRRALAARLRASAVNAQA